MDLAIVALNGFVCGQNVIRVQKLGPVRRTTGQGEQGERGMAGEKRGLVLERFGAGR